MFPLNFLRKEKKNERTNFLLMFTNSNRIFYLKSDFILNMSYALSNILVPSIQLDVTLMLSNHHSCVSHQLH
jgi:hypothetical protein